MKKAIIAVMAVIMSLTAVCFAFGCTGTTQNNDNETLRAEIEDLKDRVENNVFWTDKAEYAETETMTVYFKDTAVLEVKLDFDTAFGTAFWVSGTYVINYYVIIKSLQSDIYAETITNTSYVAWESGSALTYQSEYDTICYQNEAVATGGYVESEVAVAHEGQYDFVICVPGTAFELARFVNVTVHKRI